MTRARQHLHLVQPVRLFRSHQHRHGDGSILTMRSRFIPDALLDLFERRVYGRVDHAPGSSSDLPNRVNVAARMREMWD
jgi:DNA helicase-2/ATP-dependent DNA helicase PcrA